MAFTGVRPGWIVRDESGEITGVIEQVEFVASLIDNAPPWRFYRCYRLDGVPQRVATHAGESAALVAAGAREEER